MYTTPITEQVANLVVDVPHFPIGNMHMCMHVLFKGAGRSREYSVTTNACANYSTHIQKLITKGLLHLRYFELNTYTQDKLVM